MLIKNEEMNKLRELEFIIGGYAIAHSLNKPEILSNKEEFYYVMNHLLNKTIEFHNKTIDKIMKYDKYSTPDKSFDGDEELLRLFSSEFYFYGVVTMLHNLIDHLKDENINNIKQFIIDLDSTAYDDIKNNPFISRVGDKFLVKIKGANGELISVL